MNPIEQLEAQLRTALPSATLTLRRPRNPHGTWWLDAMRDEHRVSIEWSERRGFGVSASVLGDGYGEGPEEVFTALPETFERVRTLLAERQHTRPPTKVMLQELRARLGMTQQELATRLGVRQAAVSRLERRDDITLASLQRYVAALGGALEIGFRDATGKTWPLLSSEAEPETAAMSEPETPTQPSEEILVLRCQDLDESKAFYSELGAQLTEERHGNGPVHYSFSCGTLLVELYPSSDRHPPSPKSHFVRVVRRLLRAAEEDAEAVGTRSPHDPARDPAERRERDATPSQPPAASR
jgi:transcriptional regulator with XRE-family HTH domain